MSKFVGTVTKSDLEGGLWMLETEDGEQYELKGKLADLKDGMKARIEGKVERATMGIGMAGPTITVEKVTAL